GTCGRGLTCLDGVCMPSKECKRSDECPRGSKCLRMAGGLVSRQCVPSCTSDDDCSTEQKCMRLPLGIKQCVPRQSNCLENGCPSGSFCEVETATAWNLQTRCLKRCEPDKLASCAENEVCLPSGRPNSSGCYSRCNDAHECVSGYACIDGHCVY